MWRVITWNEKKVLVNNWSKKLAEIDYMLFLIDSNDVQEQIFKYKKLDYSELKEMLSKRLIDFAESRIYREYDLNREFQQIKINKAS
jgi:hypothetical protein